MSHNLPLLRSPADVLARYDEALAGDHLAQTVWHSEREGRWLACALGVIGKEVSSPSDCPASVMPRWLAELVPSFFDSQELPDAKAWGRNFYAALAGCGGRVPFKTFHHWHIHTVCPIGIEARAIAGDDTAPHIALQKLHERALAFDKIDEDECRLVLKEAGIRIDANVGIFTNAIPGASTNDDGYVYNDDNYAYAVALAYADAFKYARSVAYEDVWKMLADGMIESIKAVTSET